ncbi:hypothetical protein L6452_15542 [Arctium lappa]|uniref:Uncharacterized protein n=1 Tax=Arctium lappa TaxID=4217 RepID=A0ACB9CP62_ARCLA|nr:hypothetical protein L6452_15542 [Arctium lappa]
MEAISVTREISYSEMDENLEDLTQKLEKMEAITHLKGDGGESEIRRLWADRCTQIRILAADEGVGKDGRRPIIIRMGLEVRKKLQMVVTGGGDGMVVRVAAINDGGDVQWWWRHPMMQRSITSLFLS